MNKFCNDCKNEYRNTNFLFCPWDGTKLVRYSSGLDGDIHALAAYLHEKFCRSDHADDCSWNYEFGELRGGKVDWTKPAHAQWLKKATSISMMADDAAAETTKADILRTIVVGAELVT